MGPLAPSPLLRNVRMADTSSVTQGQYTDAETGFVYLRNRYYDPATGQFITRDPIEAQTREAYGYVGGNPLNYTDPLGLYPGEGLVKRGKDLIGEVGQAGKAAAIAIGKAAVEYRAEIAGVLAFGVCAYGTGGAGAAWCAGALTGAFGVRAEKRIREYGFDCALSANITDAVFTAGTFGLVRLPGKFLVGDEVGLIKGTWPLPERLLTAGFRGLPAGANLIGAVASGPGVYYP